MKVLLSSREQQEDAADEEKLGLPRSMARRTQPSDKKPSFDHILEPNEVMQMKSRDKSRETDSNVCGRQTNECGMSKSG